MTTALAPSREPARRAGVTVTRQPSTRLHPVTPYDARVALGSLLGEPVARRTPIPQSREARWACEWWPPE
jgi:hypothetical protein